LPAQRSKQKDAKKTGQTPRLAPAGRHLLSNLEQIRILADPLRVRILEAFCQERTTKQAADLIGEKPTKLYHHVDSLERVGLIKQTRTRQVRGTVEKYYLAIARSFGIDADAFRVEAGQETVEAVEAVEAMVIGVLEKTTKEIRDAFASNTAKEALNEEGIVSHIELRADQKQIDRLRKRLYRLLKDLERLGDDEEEEAENTRRFRLTLAYFPLDLK